MSPYRCPQCRKIVSRWDSTKAWIRSWCMSSGQYVRLMRVDQPPSDREEVKIMATKKCAAKPKGAKPKGKPAKPMPKGMAKPYSKKT